MKNGMPNCVPEYHREMEERSDRAEQKKRNYYDCCACNRYRLRHYSKHGHAYWAYFSEPIECEECDRKIYAGPMSEDDDIDIRICPDRKCYKRLVMRLKKKEEES